MTRLPRLTLILLCRVPWVLIAPSILVAQAPPLGLPGSIGGDVSLAVASWKSANKQSVQIDRKATREMEDSISSEIGPKGKSSEVANARRLAGGHLDLLVNSYASELRDKKYGVKGPPPGSTVVLRTSDVQGFSFATYLQGIPQDVLKDPGLLSVTSSPPGAAITIDGAARGVTDKDFVVSKGPHSVLVKSEGLNCADTVDVKDVPVVFPCPRK